MNIENADPSSESESKQLRSRWWYRWTKRLLIAYVVILVTLLTLEPFLVFPGRLFPLDGAWKNSNFNHEVVEFQSYDGTQLVGWYLPHPNATRHILLCHGNAEDAAKTSKRMGDLFRRELNANVFVFDFRGFGKSEGRPYEEGVLLDSEAAMAWLNEKTGTQPKDVIVLGHSLGGGMAVHVASKLGAKVLVLQRTFSAVVDVAQDRYWFFPISYFMKNRFESKKRIATCQIPLFQSHGTEDRVVPYKYGELLHTFSPATMKEFYTLDGANHFTEYDQEYTKRLVDFVQRVETEQAPVDESRVTKKADGSEKAVKNASKEKPDVG